VDVIPKKGRKISESVEILKEVDHGGLLVNLQDLSDQCDQLFRERRFVAVIMQCDKFLVINTDEGDQCRALRIKARALVAEDGRWTGPAFCCLREALELTQPGSHERAIVLVAFTAAYGAVGSISYCKQARDQFIQIHRTSPSSTLAVYVPDVEYNLALAYHERDRLDEAEDAYLIALDAANNSSDPYVATLKPHIMHNLIDVFQELGRHREAKSLIDIVADALGDETYGAQIRNRRARYFLHENDLQAALLWCESGLGHRSCDVHTRSALTLTKAHIGKALGQIGEAHDLGIEAMRLAAIAQSSRLSSRIARFMNQLEQGVL
jgi:tetratricopeptide (TPR) repeat protein